MALELSFIVSGNADVKIKELQKQLKQIKPVIKDTTSGIGGLNKSLLALGVSYVSFQAIKNVTTSFIKQADTAKLLESQLKLVTN